ncbi:hypothetical protein SCOR_13730 [Sulfidibacter corallicola]|uniref:Uncharacterized protein n=1 Tax=Sulfidibacter corallicola TaxID=2818388 RepID=A0A8A4TEG5_SULCO|nr:hypothetical protein [Sulfidibacter corallicola]QTD47622.1 hypothetical protein J3U87_18680 [Sulfidibacter corallicola]
MNESFIPIVVLFITPVTILFMCFTYKIINRVLDARIPHTAKNAEKPGKQKIKTFSAEDQNELRARAENLQRRLANLEEILKGHTEPRYQESQGKVSS